VGSGFEADQRMYIYDRLLENQFGFERTNVARGGSSNYTIFMRSAAAIMSNSFDIIFVQWSALNRIWLSPGPECFYFVNAGFPTFNYRNINLSRKEKEKFNTTLLTLNHDYQNIFDLVDYCKILNNLSLNKCIVVHINGIVPWQRDLITDLGDDLSLSLSDYSKEILDFDSRSDDEIIHYFTKLQNKFKELDLSLWVNPFDSFLENAVDEGPQGHHPGIKSHQWMADQVANFLIERKIV
jgi:hypothetical protein